MSKTDEPKFESTSGEDVVERARALLDARQSKTLLEENRGPTEDEIQELRQVIGDTYETALIQLAEEEEDAEQVTKSLLAANKTLSPKRGNVTMENYLKADKEFKQAHVILQRARKIRRANLSPRWAVMFVSIAYPILVFVIGLFPLPERVLGLPTLVFAWGFFGGYAAVIFRHLLRVGEKWRFENLWLWVIIRPLLGAIMGAFLYLALISGVLLFSSQINLTEIREQLILFIAFVGGFSEKFWDMLITGVLGPVQRSRDQNGDE